MKKSFPFAFVVFLIVSCSKSGTEEIIIAHQDPDAIVIIPFDPVSRDVEYLCEWQSLGVTEENASIVFTDGFTLGARPWLVRYSESTVELKISSNCGDECASTRYYIFRKRGSCIGLEYAYGTTYDLFDGITVSEFTSNISIEIQEWVVNERFTGQISIENVFTSETLVLKFWVDITEEDYFVPEDVNHTQFEECYTPQFPLNIDLDSDAIRDFTFRYDVYQQLDMLPQRNIFGISINSVASNYNLLMEEFDSAIVFSTEFGPITTENTRDYYHEYSFLANYTDFNDPYKMYNNWDSVYLNPFYSNPDLINDYLLIKKTVGTNVYYGWINFTIDVENCDIAVHETYLNPIANEHIIIN